MILKICIDCRRPVEPRTMRRGRCAECIKRYDRQHNQRYASQRRNRYRWQNNGRSPRNETAIGVATAAARTA
jgi:hypothetical protein